MEKANDPNLESSQDTLVSLDGFEKGSTLLPSITVALGTISSQDALPNDAHLLAIVGTTINETPRPPKLHITINNNSESTSSLEDIAPRASWLCDPVFAIDASIKHVRNDHESLTNTTGSIAAYRRSSLPANLTPNRRGSTFLQKEMATDESIPDEIDGIEVNPEWGLTKAGKARQRLPIACTNCRGKKIKCLVNKDGGTCLNCLKSETLKKTCRTEARPRRQSSGIRKEKPKKRASVRRASENNTDGSATDISRSSSKEYTELQEDALLSAMEPSLLSLSGTGSQTYPPANYHSHYLAQIAQPGVADSLLHRASIPPAFSVGSQTQDAVFSLHSPSSEPPPMFSSSYSVAPDGAYDPRLFSMPLVQEPVNLSPSASLNSSITLKPGIIELPNDYTLNTLVRLFFTHIHWQGYGFLHPASFLRNLKSQPPALLLCICTASCRLSEEFSRGNASRAFENQAKQLALAEELTPSLTGVQCFLLLAFHFSATGDIQQASSCSKIAISMVKAINLESSISEEQGDLDGSSTIGRVGKRISMEMRKRTLWSAYAQDRSKPVNEIQVSNYSMSQSAGILPCHESTFDLLNESNMTGISSPLTIQPGSIGVMAYLIRIVNIRATLLHSIKVDIGTFESSPQLTGGIRHSDIIGYYADLKKWRHDLPSCYQHTADNFKPHFDGEHSAIETICLMHLIYHVTINQYHRYRPDNASFSDDYLPCFSSALAVLAILRTVAMYNEEIAKPIGKKLQLVSPFVAYAIATACDTLSRLVTFMPDHFVTTNGRILTNPKIGLFFGARAYIRESLQLLRNHISYNKSAADAYVSIRRLCIDIKEACVDDLTGSSSQDALNSGSKCVPRVRVNLQKLKRISSSMQPMSSKTVDILYHADHFEMWYLDQGYQEIERLTEISADRQNLLAELPEIDADTLKMVTTSLPQAFSSTDGILTAGTLPLRTNPFVSDYGTATTELPSTLGPSIPGSFTNPSITFMAPTTAASAADHTLSILATGAPEISLQDAYDRPSSMSLTPNLSASSVLSLPVTSTTTTPVPIISQEYPATTTEGWSSKNPISGLMGFTSLDFTDLVNLDGGNPSMQDDISMEDLLGSNIFNGLI